MDDEFAVEIIVGERFDLDDVADVEFVRVGLHVAREAVDAFELIVDTEAVDGNVLFAPMANIFALGVGLPIDGAHIFPTAVLLAAVAVAVGATGSAVDAHDGTGGGGAECLTELNDGGSLRRLQRQVGIGDLNPVRRGSGIELCVGRSRICWLLLGLRVGGRAGGIVMVRCDAWRNGMAYKHGQRDDRGYRSEAQNDLVAKFHSADTCELL